MIQARPDMPRRLPSGCVEDRDRHGNTRIYFRTKGQPKVRLRGTPWTPEFMTAYEAAKGRGGADHRQRDHAGHLAMAVHPLLRGMRGVQTP